MWFTSDLSFGSFRLSSRVDWRKSCPKTTKTFLKLKDWVEIPGHHFGVRFSLNGLCDSWLTVIFGRVQVSQTAYSGMGRVVLGALPVGEPRPVTATSPNSSRRITRARINRVRIVI
jgi:hypothetical protein